MEIQINLTQKSFEDLEKIIEYYKNFNKDYKKIINDVYRQIEYLKTFPTMGMLLENITIKNKYRYTKSGNFYIFYKNLDNLVYIERILHSKRDCLSILLED